MSEVSKVVGYKIDTQKSSVFLDTSNKRCKTVRNKFIYDSIKKDKILRVNLTKDMKDMQ